MIEKLPFGSYLKSYLDSKETYRRWKYSELALWLYRQFSKKQSEIIKKEDLFYRALLMPLLPDKAPIFDVGANTGWLSKTFLDFSRNVIAVEPDKFSQEILDYRFGELDAFTLVPKAVSENIGFKEFLVQEEGSALNTFSDKWKKELELGYFAEQYHFTSKKVTVQTTTLNQLIKEYGLPCIAKIDVEGHELEVFYGLSQSIPLIVFEANLPVFLDETKEIINILESLDAQVAFNYAEEFVIEHDKYLTSNELLVELDTIGKKSLDIICRMSNYETFYEISLEG